MSTNPIHAALRSSNAASWQIKAEIFDQLLDTYDFAVEVVSHVQIFEHCHTQIQNLMAEEANYKYPFGMFQAFDEAYFNCAGEYWRNAYPLDFNRPEGKHGLMTFLLLDNQYIDKCTNYEAKNKTENDDDDDADF